MEKAISRLFIAGALILLLISSQIYAATITDIFIHPQGGAIKKIPGRVEKVRILGGKTVIEVLTDSPCSAQYSLAANGIILTIPNSTHNLSAYQYMGVNRGGVKTIIAKQIAPTTVQIAFNLEYAPSGFNMNQGNDKIILSFDNKESMAYSVWNAITYNQGANFNASKEWSRTPFFRGGSGRRISLDLQSAELRAVLRLIADYSGYNIISGEDVKGTVTIKVKNVSWKNALVNILKANGYAAKYDHGIIRVGKINDLYQEDITEVKNERDRDELIDLETKVYYVNFANAAELKSTITKLLSKRGQIEIDERTNSVVVTDIPKVLGNVNNIVKQLDSRTPQVMIEAKLVEVDYRASKEFGVNWRAGNAEDYTVDTHMQGNVNLGVGNPTGSIQFGTLINGFNLDATLSFLQETNKARILSEPRIAIVNNREGTVISGKKIPLSLKDESGNTVTKLMDVGVKLTVKPHINSDNKITLDLNPEVSDLSGEATVSGDIIILTSQATTRLIINDGETAVIGGIMRSKKSQLTRAIPILSKIPLLGKLFEYKADTVDRTELLIFVTPHIIKSGDI
ncbi:MAG: type IV pilus secretin PilQ [Candidatus Coatesbacteria bacterium]|nr:type IV pilus secretin PilQ [Candidatus Coatesbacteria bacterium]